MNHNNSIYYLVVIIISTFFGACSGDVERTLGPNIVEYVHISHTLTDKNPEVAEAAASIDYSKFDMRWLGGDMAFLSSIDEETIQNIDLIFDIGHTNTLWSLGNHDYDNLNLLELYTRRPTFYTHHKNGITFLLIDSQKLDLFTRGSQKSFIDSTISNVANSTHLILLHHKLFWLYGDEILEPQIDRISNSGLGEELWNIYPNEFYNNTYPALAELEQNGVEVICIGGDIGNKAKKFEYLTSEGIDFLASGIDFESSNNYALVFQHDTLSKNLTWEYTNINDL